MTRVDQFRCSYCGSLAALHQATIFWTFADRLPDGIELYVLAAYCSPFCGQEHATGAVGRS